MASSSRMSEDDVIKMVDERIKYANNNFSSLKAGWTSDMVGFTSAMGSFRHRKRDYFR